MQYSSYSYSNGSGPVFSLRDDKLIAHQTRLTTSDALRVQWIYCGFRTLKPYMKCGKKSKTVVFNDRICDQEPDCPNLEDENGKLGICKKINSNSTDQECCLTILMKRLFY